MPKVEIYTGMMCGFCHRAKELLKKKNVSFKEINISMSGKLRQEMMSRSGGGYTVPQIFIDDMHVGGCDELYAMDRQGKLDQLLNIE
ncbi:MAG: glutaredoxin 3 [Sphingomonadales bacterium]|nr:glutaredoxin 3 [Sphingomonadales bacterium]